MIHPLTADELARFMRCFSRPNEGCWLWTSNLADTGYGRFYYRGKLRLAHRFVYEHFRGAITCGLELDHLCRNRNCVRPDHLEPVTHQENMRRGMEARGLATDDPVRKPRRWVRGPNRDETLLTHCRRGHEYTPENTYIVPNREVRARRCRKCLRLAQAKERAKIRAQRFGGRDDI